MSPAGKAVQKMAHLVFGLAGWSGSGKTTLAEKLIKHITDQAIIMATIKHAHHAFDADSPGKDSWRHRQAGARQVIVSSAHRTAHFTEHAQTEPDLTQLLAQLGPCDLVLVEGFKKEPIDKLEIWREQLGKPPLYPQDKHIVAVASDVELPECPLPVFDLNDAAAISDFILSQVGLKKSN